MRKIIILIGTGLFFLSSCKKEFKVPTDLANINVVHAIVNMPLAVVNTSGQPGIWNALSVSNTNKISYGGSLSNALIAKSGAYFSIAALPDTLSPFYTNPKLNLQPGDIYTLFLAGIAGAVDPILVKEQFVPRADSATGIRFINLMSNGNPISVNIKNVVTPEVKGLAYKQMSDFIVYDAHIANSTYDFEIKDDVTGLVLTTYQYNQYNPIARARNETLVIRGLKGGTGTNAPGITRAKHY